MSRQAFREKAADIGFIKVGLAVEVDDIESQVLTRPSIANVGD